MEKLGQTGWTEQCYNQRKDTEALNLFSHIPRCENGASLVQSGLWPDAHGYQRAEIVRWAHPWLGSRPGQSLPGLGYRR